MPSNESQKPKALRRVGLIGALCLILFGAGSCSGKPATVSFNACGSISLQTYSVAMGKQLANEIDAAPGSAVFPSVIADYHRLRLAVRACATVK